MIYDFVNFLRAKWQSYRYRFVPWIIFNLKNRTVRSVDNTVHDKIISDETTLNSLTNLFNALDRSNSSGIDASSYKERLIVMNKVMGFAVDRGQSSLPGGGVGVYVTMGTVKKGAVVSLYPGTIYDPHNPILIQSLGNPFIFRCIDGILLDGNDKNLSKYIFRSCCQRDRHGPYLTSDPTWLTQYPVNPLAIGQYVNNGSKKFPANVAYQELDLPLDFPFHLMKYIPNVHYTPVSQLLDPNITRLRRVVVLVSLKEIQEGEELLSSYFTIVR